MNSVIQVFSLDNCMIIIVHHFATYVTNLWFHFFQVQRKIDKLTTECKEEEKRHWNRVAELQKKNQVF